MGQPLEGLIGKTDYDLFPKALADKYVRDDQKVLQTGEVFEDIEGHQKPDGSKTYVHVLKAPVLNARHEVVGTQVIYWDVTARKNAEEQLKQAYADLQKTNEVLRATQLQLIEAEKMQSVGRLAAGVAHEVRNPLAVLGLGLDYLANVAAGDPVLTDMRNALKRADAIIYGLCEFSALNELQCQPADLNQVLEQALTMVEPECGEQGIRLVKELAANLPPVRFDPDKIKQVLVSLLTNAVQAMAGGGCLTVRTSARQLQADEVSQDAGSRQAERLHARALVAVVEISDTGPGVPAANLPKVFDAFFTTKPTGKGIGLGLTVSRKIIELHGGDLQLKNRPEGGLSAMLLLKAD
jgi:PAS domain S-box-containing protein